MTKIENKYYEFCPLGKAVCRPYTPPSPLFVNACAVSHYFADGIGERGGGGECAGLMCLNEGMFKGAKVVARRRSRHREDSRQPNLKRPRGRGRAREGGDFEIASKGWEEEKCTENELCYALDPHSICGEMLFC